MTTTKKGKVKAESMIACLADYQAMKAKIQLYQETLGLRQEELLASLDRLSATAHSLMETAAESMAGELETEEAPQGAEETNEQEGSTADIGAEGDDEEA